VVAHHHHHHATQAPLIPELSLLANNADLVGKLFSEPPAGCRNSDALSSQDLAWFRQAFCQTGAATAALNYYRR
jgi:hypothetical protein